MFTTSFIAGRDLWGWGELHRKNSWIPEQSYYRVYAYCSYDGHPGNILPNNIYFLIHLFHQESVDELKDTIDALNKAQVRTKRGKGTLTDEFPISG